MKKTFSFGKIAYVNPKRRANEVSVEVRLEKQGNGEYKFAAVGEIWNSRHTDLVSCGQNLDQIAKYVGKNEVFREIYALWKDCHLNTMRAGTRRQEKIVDEHFRKENKPYDYNEAVKVLKKHRRYYDKLGEGEVPNSHIDTDRYAYGTAWLTWVIPDKELSRMFALFN